MTSRLLWLTERSTYHQQRALKAAPTNLTVTMRTEPEVSDVDLAMAELLVSERRGVIDENLLKRMPHLRFILRLGATVHDIDLAAVERRGIRLSRQPDIGSQLVAEHCVACTLALLKHLNEAQYRAHHYAGNQMSARTDENTFRYNWAGMHNVSGLVDKIVGIAGMGDIGIELARRLKLFCPGDIYYFKRTRLPQWFEAELKVKYAPFNDMISHVDILITLLPFSAASEHLIDDEILRQLPKGALLIQAGSGRTIEETALADLLGNGHLGGAALDTFEYEPLQPDHSLLKLASDPASNIILTPHIAAGTLPITSTREHEYAEIERFLTNQPLQHGII